MGKLVEALKKRAQALQDYKSKSRVQGQNNGNPPSYPKYEDDPQKAYAFIQRVNELNNQFTRAGRLLTEAFSKIQPEQRRAFFQRELNAEKKESLARSGFSNVLNEAYNKEDNGEALRGFFEDPNSFGRPIAELIPAMEKILKPEELEKVRAELKPDASAAEKAAAIFQEMDPIQKDQLYETLVEPERKESYLFHALELLFQRGRIGGILLNNEYYKEGKTWIDGMEGLEQVMGPQLTEEIARQIDELLPPQQDPKMTAAPYAGRIQELGKGLSAEDPKKELLKKVGDILVYPTEEYRHYLNAQFDTVAGVPGMDYSVTRYGNYLVQKALQDKIGQQLMSKLPHEASESGYDYYLPVKVEPARKRKGTTLGIELTEQELQLLRQSAGGEPLSGEVHQAVKDVIDGIEALGEKKYWNPGVVDLVEGSWEDPKKVRYAAEQGDKKYAFWPLVNAKKALARAVQEGQWDKIQQAHDEYARCKAITDKMLNAANRTGKDPIFPPNVNSTRAELDPDSLNPMPSEYLEDYAGHSRVNGLFLLYTAGKNSGLSIDRILDDPGGTLHALAQKHINEELLSSRKSKPMGARLVHGFDSKLQMNANVKWRNTLNMVGRAMDSVSGLIPDKEARIRHAGRNYCAAAAANYEVGREGVAWINLTGARPEKKRIVCQLAMLLPEDQFDLQDVGLKLGREDLQDQLNPVSAIARLQRENKLDYAAVTSRSKQILQDVEAALREKEQGLQMLDPHGKKDLNLADYQRAALQNYNQIMRTAPLSHCGTEAYKQMAAHAAQLQDALYRHEMKNNGATLEENRAQINEQLVMLDKKKTGWFLSSKNSPEYLRMVKRIKLLNLKLDMLEGKPKPQNLSDRSMELIRKANLADLIFAAKNDCLQYASLKTKEGKSGIIHEAGQDRLDHAQKLYEKLGKLSENLGIRSPAMTLKDHCEMYVLRNRGTKGWEAQNAEKYAAKVVYAMSLQYRGVPWEKQAKLLEQDALNTAVEKIRVHPAFRKMVENEGAAGLAAKIVQGTSVLTDAYMNAANQVAHPDGQPQRAPARSNEEKIEFWRDQENPVIVEEAHQL